MGAIHVCDICGKQLGYTPAPLTVYIDDETSDGKYDREKQFEMCSNCAKKFNKMFSDFVILRNEQMKEGVADESERKTRVDS